MASGKLILQANDGKTLSLTAPEGMSENTVGIVATTASPTFTGTVVLPSTTSIGNVSNTELSYLDGVTSAIQTQLGTKAPLASPALTGTPKVNNVPFSGHSGFKNYIINGNFDVWQRGTSQTSSGYGSDDRWINHNTGSTKTHSQIACTDTERALFSASKFSRTVVSSVAGAGNYTSKVQRIEDITRLAGKTVTLSFWAKADASKNIAFDFAQLFGTGGSPSANVAGIGAQKVALTTSWQKITRTVALPSIVGKTLGTDGVHTTNTQLEFFFEAGSNLNTRTASLGQQSGTFDIAQVQLEEGSVATPFEHRPYGLELSLCQRYYVSGLSRWDGYNGGIGVTTGTPVWFPTGMRVNPTLAQTHVGGTSFSTTVYNSTINVLGFFDERVTTDVGNAAWLTSWTASAEL